MAYNAIDIAKKLIIRAVKTDQQEPMTNMRLQKMLYYQQGFHLAAFNKPLFNEKIEAWMYGPVVPAVYEAYKSYGFNCIIPDEDATEIRLNEQEEHLFSEVFGVYGVYSAIGLMNLTHNESPWKSVPARVGSVISQESMRQYFKTRLSE